MGWGCCCCRPPGSSRGATPSLRDGSRQRGPAVLSDIRLATFHWEDHSSACPVGRKSEGKSFDGETRPASSWRDVQPPFTSPWPCDEARKLTLRRGNVEAATTVRGMLEPNLGSHCCCRPGRTPHLGHRRPRCPGHDGPATRQGQTLPTAAGGDVVSSSSKGQTAAHSRGNSH